MKRQINKLSQLINFVSTIGSSTTNLLVFRGEKKDYGESALLIKFFLPVSSMTISPSLISGNIESPVVLCSPNLSINFSLKRTLNVFKSLNTNNRLINKIFFSFINTNSSHSKKKHKKTH